MLVVVALLAASCSSVPSSATSTTKSTTVTPEQLLPSVRNSKSTDPPVTSTATTVRSAPVACTGYSGYQTIPQGRTMLVRDPPSAVLRPALIMVHGYTATPEGEEAVSGWTSFFRGTDVVVAYPEGNPTPVSGYGWSTGADKLATTGTDDSSVILNTIGVLTSQDCVDPREIIVAGESNGSALALEAACDPRMVGKAVLFALAIPAVDANVSSHCAGASPFPLLVMAGKLDQTVPIGGAPAGTVGFTAPQVWFDQLAASVEGCTGSTTTSVPDGIHESFTHCSQRADFFEVSDGHHTWPGGPLGAGGLSPGVFPGTGVVWCRSGLVTQPAPVSCPSVLASYGLTAGG